MRMLRARHPILFLVPILALALASCADSPVELLQPDAALEHSSDGSCDGDFHFGDNCTDPDGNPGTHLRLAHVNWVATENANEAEFTYTFGARRSFYGSLNVGDQRQFARVHMGNGFGLTPNFTVTFIDAASDWFEARATFRYQYAGPGPYTVYSEDCCRLSLSRGVWYHPNNPDHSTRIQGVVDFASAGSPATSIQPLVPCAPDAQCDFRVAATAPAGQAIQWRLATPFEMGSSASSHPSGASIDAETGLYSWNTTGATVSPDATDRTVYSTQVVMETVTGTGEVTSASAIDFLIEITGAGNAPPQWVRGPTPVDGATYDVLLGSSLSLDVEAMDSDVDDVVTLGALGVPANASFGGGSGNPVSSGLTFTPSAAQLGQNYVVNFVATDDRGASAPSLSIVLNVVELTNAEPTAVAGGPYTGQEGSPVSFDGTGSSDPDGDDLTYSWDFGDGNTGTGPTPSHTYADNGSYTVTLSVEDEEGATDENTTTATIDNVAPSVGSIADLPSDPVGVGTAVSLRAAFTDAGVLDTHSAVIDWGDGSTSAGSLSQGSGSGSVSGTHAYTAAGVYAVTVTVTDNDGDSGSSLYEYVVVFDPDGGFVTGGGWVDVPAASYTGDLAAAGPARFGFVSKYLPGRVEPDGSTQFQFRAAGLNFHSNDYDWLVISGPRAQYKGEGTLNRDGGYCFLLTATDGDVNGGDGLDRFRLKIWECDTDAIVFDNQMADADDADPTAVTQGSIVIHKK